jgi:hypothetical protein
MTEFFATKITKDKSRDTGMALVLLLLLLSLGVRQQTQRLLLLAMVLHVVNMIVPQVYKPAAVVWFGLANVIGSVMSKVLLTVVFFVVVTPTALLRRLAGKDSLKLKAFKTGDESAMHVRNHVFVSADIEKPY